VLGGVVDIITYDQRGNVLTEKRTITNGGVGQAYTVAYVYEPLLVSHYSLLIHFVINAASPRGGISVTASHMKRLQIINH
jgi:hypothetical protein